MIISEINPTINFLDETQRKDGVSAFLRVKNGAEYLKISIDSIIDQIDELVCVVNQSTDKTLDILENYQKFCSKIKIYDYKPVVYPPGSEEYKKYPENSVHSLPYYYNFALSKTTYQYAIKLDDDEIFFPNIIKTIHSICKKNLLYKLNIRGINLLDIDKKLFINKKYAKTGGADKVFFRYNSSCIFTKNLKCEIFQSNHKLISTIDGFYHLKFCKSDRGQNNYNLTSNMDSEYQHIGKNFLTQIKSNLIPINTIIEKTKYDPFDLGFYFINNSQKKYNYNEFQKIEDKI